jgi:ribosome recycling factor
VAEHRQELCKQLDEVEVTRDLFRQTLTEQTSQTQQHPLMQQIDNWERESIDKIQKAANDARQLLVDHTTGHITIIESQLNKLTDELRKSREEDDFFETDLSRWKREIARLTEALQKPSTVRVRQNSTSLVTKIVVDVDTGRHYIYTYIEDD